MLADNGKVVGIDLNLEKKEKRGHFNNTGFRGSTMLRQWLRELRTLQKWPREMRTLQQWLRRMTTPQQSLRGTATF